MTEIVVSDGAEAIARFRAATLDLVSTDLAIPGLTGWDVARAITATRPEVPVFLVTGFGVEASAEELHANGVDAVLPTPLLVEDVHAIVARPRSERGQAGGGDPA